MDKYQEINKFFEIKDTNGIIKEYVPIGERWYLFNEACSEEEKYKTIKEHLHQGTIMYVDTYIRNMEKIDWQKIKEIVLRGNIKENINWLNKKIMKLYRIIMK